MLVLTLFVRTLDTSFFFFLLATFWYSNPLCIPCDYHCYSVVLRWTVYELVLKRVMRNCCCFSLYYFISLHACFSFKCLEFYLYVLFFVGCFPSYCLYLVVVILFIFLLLFHFSWGCSKVSFYLHFSVASFFYSLQLSVTCF